MATNDQVQSLYIAYFGRPADDAGLTFWTEDSETPLETIADGFAGTDEYKAATAGDSIEQIINSFYVNLFGRNADTEGLQFFTQRVLAGDTTLQQVGVKIGQAAVTADPATTDTATLEAKFDAANQWTTSTAASTAGLLAYTGAAGIEAGINYLQPVVDADSVPTQEATDNAVNSLIADNSTGDSLDLTVFQDVADASGYVRLTGTTVLEETAFKLDGDNQVLNATSATLNNGDVLDDAAGTDSDVLNVTLSGVQTIVPGANGITLNNIETVNYELTNYNNAVNVNTMTIAGTDAFNASGTLAAGGVFTLTGSAGSSSIDVSGLAFTGTDTTATTNLVTAGGTTVTGFVGTDVVTTGGDGDSINLGAGDNNITVNGNHTTTVTHDVDGANLAIALNGTDTLTLNASSTGAVVTSNGSNTTLAAGGSTAALTVTGDGGNDTFTTGSGADTITTGAGTNSVTAGSGNDNVTGGAGADTMSGGIGNDTIVSGGGADTLNGDGGNDTLTGNAGAETINGGTGNDSITSAAGADTISGGTGVDTIRYAAAGLAAADADTITDFALAADIVSLNGAVAGGVAGNITAVVNNIAGSADNTIIVDAANTGYANFAAAELAVNGANANTDDYVVIFNNTTSGNVEMYIDADSGVVGNGVLLASFTNQTAATFLAGLAAANFTVA